jgi:hypothetical protein
VGETIEQSNNQETDGKNNILRIFFKIPAGFKSETRNSCYRL